MHPFADALHRHFLARHQAALDQHAAHRHIGVAVMRIIIDVHHGAVFEPDLRRSFDADEQRIGLAAHPANLEVLAVERAVLDRAAVVIGNELAVRHAAECLARVGERRAVGEAGRGEIGRPAIERHREFPRRETRAVDDRLVIAGEEARRFAELADAHRNEIGFEELARRGAFQWPRLDRAARRPVRAPHAPAGRRRRPAEPRAAACACACDCSARNAIDRTIGRQLANKVAYALA